MNTVPPSTPPSQSPDVLERITLQMASSLDLQVVLATITQGLEEVEELAGPLRRRIAELEAELRTRKS